MSNTTPLLSHTHTSRAVAYLSLSTSNDSLSLTSPLASAILTAATRTTAALTTAALTTAAAACQPPHTWCVEAVRAFFTMSTCASVISSTPSFFCTCSVSVELYVGSTRFASSCHARWRAVGTDGSGGEQREQQ